MRSIEEIYQALLASFSEKAGFQPEEGCDLAVRLYAVAAQLQALEIQGEWVLDQSFPQTAQGEYLDRHGVMRGLNRTAAAKAVAESGDITCAAIGSRRAAALYGLEVLVEGINDNDSNYTRFVVVSPVMERRPGRNKVSALFTLPHRSGTLHQIMSVFAVAAFPEETPLAEERKPLSPAFANSSSSSSSSGNPMPLLGALSGSTSPRNLL